MGLHKYYLNVQDKKLKVLHWKELFDFVSCLKNVLPQYKDIIVQWFLIK